MSQTVLRCCSAMIGLKKIGLWAFGVLFGVIMLAGCGGRDDTVVSIAIHPTKNNIMYMATNEAVYKTRDRGKSWDRLSGELQRTRVMNLTIDPHLPANVLAGTMADGMYKSPDGGRRWLAHNSGLQKGTISVNVQDLVFDPQNTQTVYAATTVGIFRSTDGGQSWTERMAGMTEVTFVVSLAVDPESPNVMYAGTSGGMFRSKNATESWVKINSGLVPDTAKMASMALGVNVVAIDPLATKTIYAGTTQGLFKSNNRGDSWDKIDGNFSEEYISTLIIDAKNPNVLYMGTSQGIHKSLDAGAHWQLLTQGLESHNVRVIQMDPKDSQTLFCGTNGGGLHQSTDGGETWVRLPIIEASTES